MNARERFNAIMNFEQGIKNLKLEYGYWAGLLKKWPIIKNSKDTNIFSDLLDGDLVRMSCQIQENSDEIVDEFIIKYFELDPYPSKFPFDLSPQLKEKKIEENNEYEIYIDEYGLTQKKSKRNASVPMTLNYAIKTDKDFCEYKNLYDKDFKKRLPSNWQNLIKTLKNREFPIRLGGSPFGFCGLTRHLMGDVNYMLGLYDNPKLLKDISEFYLNFTMNYWSVILDKVDIDMVMIWEDMAFKTGSFISKDAFREFLTPFYIRFIDFLKQYKIKNIIVDCDGFIEELIPLWIEVGVTGIFPLEAVNDLKKIRELFPNLQILGGIDKRILINNINKSIDLELEKISLLLKKGGFIPHIDHSIPMDAEWDLFKEYREKLNNIIDNK